MTPYISSFNLSHKRVNKALTKRKIMKLWRVFINHQLSVIK